MTRSLQSAQPSAGRIQPISRGGSGRCSASARACTASATRARCAPSSRRRVGSERRARPTARASKNWSRKAKFARLRRPMLRAETRDETRTAPPPSRLDDTRPPPDVLRARGTGGGRMRHSSETRLGVLSVLAALLIAACSGGFGGTSAAPTAAPVGSAPASAPAASDTGEAVKLTYFVDDNNVTAARLQGLIDAYTKLHPNVTIEVETHPGGTEGDNVVKTRLATGDMSDLFYYNSGSLLQALNPAETLVDLSGEPFIDNIVETYLPTVTAGDAIVGVPTEGTLGGGILYNKKIYADNNLQVPKTWAEFAANNETIKAA